MNRIVVHYHEIALKRGNRPAFVRRLVENIGATLRGTGVKRIRSLPGRIIVHLKPEADHDEIRTRMRRVCGVANFSLAWRCDPIIDDMIETALEAIGGTPFGSFAVRCKRSDKGFPMTSMDVDRVVGAAIVDRYKARVDLTRPELSVRIEILPRETFVAVENVAGAGGLPVGISGRVVGLLSGGIDSPVAAYRMMRRGAQVELVHFHGAPYQNRTSREKAAELAQLLAGYQLRSRLHLVAFGDIQSQIVAAVPRPYRVVLYRRMMVRIAGAIADQVGAAALVTGESLGQVASQTLENMIAVEDAAPLPILRPLVGMDKLEITEQARNIGTFETSIQPDQDCCQLFVPTHPATRMTVAEAREAESALDVATLISQGLAGTEVEEFRFPPQSADADPQISQVSAD
jgi:thiamine biosynthesis protein ThiI